MSCSKLSAKTGSGDASAFVRASPVSGRSRAGAPFHSKSGWSWTCNTFAPGRCGWICKFSLRPSPRFCEVREQRRSAAACHVFRQVLNPQNKMMASTFSQARGSLCVTELVARQTAVNPSALAVSSCHETLSYADLDRRANRLANYLRSVGVSRGMTVGLCLERSAAMVVTALAILKAGGAYIPLDPVQPVARLGFMLRDAEARVVVGTTGSTSRLARGAWQLVTLDGDEEKIADQPATYS